MNLYVTTTSFLDENGEVGYASALIPTLNKEEALASAFLHYSAKGYTQITVTAGDATEVVLDFADTYYPVGDE